MYERFRNSVEYHEEHLLRKNAIKRIIRRLLMYYRDHENMTNLLVDDLIRTGYFKNETIPEAALVKIQATFEKYQVVFDEIGKKPFQERQKLQDWVLGILACEVEDILVSSEPQEAFSLPSRKTSGPIRLSVVVGSSSAITIPFSAITSGARIGAVDFAMCLSG